ncbi:PilN domain-containing protein [Halalkalibaculum sp. DA3122]|uniref:PilN domain-containing protein n=1 Tax=Halalkalibaculum sp. DA3122 TaxID=3373607 RepID=UPI0037552ADF
MFGSKVYTGIVIEGSQLKIARVKSEKGKVRLVKLDKIGLIDELKPGGYDSSEGPEGGDFEEDQDADSIFGLGELEGDGGEEELEEINLDDMDEEPVEDDDMLSLDMVEEADSGTRSNEVLLYETLTEIDPDNLRLGLNVEAGDTIFQIIRDTNFNEVKKKDLIADLEEKLESIYGTPKSSDRYDYEIRENGSLLLASTEEDPKLLELVNETRELYGGKLFIDDILPDEVSLVGLVKANYELQPDQITGIIQFGPERCRLIFMNGEEVWLVSPIINEGTKNRGFLNTIFSKILFQLDTGEVPNLDRLILANNTLGTEATDFFKKNFPDVSVENFRFESSKFDYGDQDPVSADAFTTAIGVAWAASGVDREHFPDISLLPGYVLERQKIFKLQWHGIMLLFLIFMAPVTLNYFYQQNARQIQTMESDLTRINSQIEQVTPTVNAANKLSDQLAILREELVLLDTLSRGTREWTRKLQILNNGMSENVQATWFTGMQNNQDGTSLNGYALYRNQIPDIVDIFADATLLNVSIEEIREQEVYRFSIRIKEFSDDKTQFSPPRPEDLKTILGK